MKSLHVLGIIALGIIIGVLLTNFISPDIALFVSFIAIVAGLILLDRKSVKLEGIVIMRRTKRGRDFIDRVAKANPKFWRIAGSIGVILGVLMMIVGTLFIATSAYGVASGASKGGVRLLLPGPVSSPVSVPGVFVVPWWIWVIGIAVVIVPHEFMHGIMCRIDGVRIKSVGWLLLAIIPGAFVEPDEKQLAKQKLWTKLRVYAAGSFANLIVAIIVVFVFVLVLSPALAPAGVFVAAVEGGPSYNASLNGSIISINGQPTRTHNDLSTLLDGYRPGDTVTVTTAETKYVVTYFTGDVLSPQPAAVIDTEKTKSYSVTLGANDNGKAYLGVYVAAQAVTMSMDPNIFIMASTLLLWMFIFSFGIGIVNMLPIGPLDGGQFFGAATKKKVIAKTVSAIVLALLLFNIIGPFFIG